MINVKCTKGFNNEKLQWCRDDQDYKSYFLWFRTDNNTALGMGIDNQFPLRNDKKCFHLSTPLTFCLTIPLLSLYITPEQPSLMSISGWLTEAGLCFLHEHEERKHHKEPVTFIVFNNPHIVSWWSVPKMNRGGVTQVEEVYICSKGLQHFFTHSSSPPSVAARNLLSHDYHSDLCVMNLINACVFAGAPVRPPFCNINE